MHDEQWMMCKDQWYVKMEPWTKNKDHWLIKIERWTKNNIQWIVYNEQWAMDKQGSMNNERWTVNDE